MHKNRILFLREPEVHTILRRCLSKIGYRIYPKVRLSDAIAKDQGEWLPDREFEYLCKAHLDFLIVKDDFPVFAVGFDGLQHLEDAHTIARDVMKNRLCKAADLPLLRITSREIFKRDEITILDYMLMRYAAWQDEIADIMAEIKVYADTIGPDANPDDLCVDLDPGFHFDLRHPFPATKTVLERLWRNHQIVWDMVGDSRRQKARFLCDVGSRRCGQLHHDQFHTCELTAIAWAPSASLREPIHSETVSVTIRSWLPRSWRTCQNLTFSSLAVHSLS